MAWLLVALPHSWQILTCVHFLVKITEGFLLLLFWRSVSSTPPCLADFPLDSTFPSEEHILRFLVLSLFPTHPQFLNPSTAPSGINSGSPAKSHLISSLSIPFSFFLRQLAFSSALLDGGYFFTNWYTLTTEYGGRDIRVLLASNCCILTVIPPLPPKAQLWISRHQVISHPEPFLVVVMHWLWVIPTHFSRTLAPDSLPLSPVFSNLVDFCSNSFIDF